MFKNTTASNNSAVGTNALRDNTTANTVSVTVPLQSNTTANDNTAVGTITYLNNYAIKFTKLVEMLSEQTPLVTVTRMGFGSFIKITGNSVAFGTWH